MSAAVERSTACPRCGGRLLRDLELGLEALGTDRVMKCINCGHVPAQRPAPTAEEQAAPRLPGRPTGTPRTAARPWTADEVAAWERALRPAAEVGAR